MKRWLANVKLNSNKLSVTSLLIWKYRQAKILSLEVSVYPFCLINRNQAWIETLTEDKAIGKETSRRQNKQLMLGIRDAICRDIKFSTITSSLKYF